jgi:alpha-ketoglutarate-dependent taurine dioxygenase
MTDALTIRPLADSTFGAVVENLDVEAVVGADPSTEVWDQLYAAWIEHALIILPEAFLTRAQQVALAKRFGSIELLGGREIVALSNVTPSGALRGEDDMMKVLRGNMDWHVDSTYMPLQSKGAVFSADIVPTEGGGTGFADMRAAYAVLDDDTKSMVDDMSAHHSLHRSQRAHGHVHSEDSDYVGYGLEHSGAPLRPLVKHHPVTGTPSLLIGRHAYGIPGLAEQESERLLTELVDGACQSPRVYEHQWRSGDAVIWDNRCLLHRAQPWDMSEPRTMWHTRIAGDNESEFAPLVPDTGTVT